MAVSGHQVHAGGDRAGADADSELGFQAVVISDHTSDDELQLKLKIGDIVHVLEEDETGWAGGYKDGEEDVTGWFPRMCIQPCAQDASPEPHKDAKKDDLAVGALETSTVSPFRQKRTVATPQAGAQASQQAMVQGSTEDAKLKQQLCKAEEDLASATEKLTAERALRQKLEQELEKMGIWQQDFQQDLEKMTTSKRAVEDEMYKKELQLQEMQAQIGGLQSELSKKSALLRNEEERRQQSEQELDEAQACLRQKARATVHAERETAPMPRAHAMERAPASSPNLRFGATPPVCASSPAFKPSDDVLPCTLFSEDPGERPARRGSVRDQIKVLERRSSSQIRTQLKQETTPRRSNSVCRGSVRGIEVGAPVRSSRAEVMVTPCVAAKCSELPSDSGDMREAPILGLSPLTRGVSSKNMLLG